MNEWLGEATSAAEMGVLGTKGAYAEMPKESKFKVPNTPNRDAKVVWGEGGERCGFEDWW